MPMPYVAQIMSIVGASAGAGTTITIPTHQAGDTILIAAFRDGSNTAPSLPAGWTAVANGGANTCSMRVGVIVATGSGTTSGTWTNATHLMVVVIRPSLGTTTIKVSTPGQGNSTTVTYPALTPLFDQDGGSWVIAFAGHTQTNTTLETPPTGMANLATFADATSEVAIHGARLADWTQVNQSVGGTASGWHTYVVEVRHPKLPNQFNTGTTQGRGNAGQLAMNGGNG